MVDYGMYGVHWDEDTGEFVVTESLAGYKYFCISIEAVAKYIKGALEHINEAAEVD